MQSRWRTTRRMLGIRPFRHAQTCGATKIGHGNVASMELAGDAQMEIGRIGQQSPDRVGVRRRQLAVCGIRDECGADAQPLPAIRPLPDWRNRLRFRRRRRADADRCSRKIAHRATRGVILRPPAQRKDLPRLRPPTRECYAASILSVAPGGFRCRAFVRRRRHT